MIPLIGKDFPNFLIREINDAKKSIDLCVYDWRFYPERPEHPVSMFNQALVRAVRRGVRVRALINSREFVRILNDMGINAKNPKDKRVLHSKFILIDENTLSIGSHNFTSNAFTSNYETSVLIDECSCAERFALFFETLYNF